MSPLRIAALWTMLACSGCSTPRSLVDRSERIAHLESESGELLASARRLRVAADAAATAYSHASELYSVAAATWGGASEQARAAAEDLDRATLQYRMTTMAVVLIALTPGGSVGGICQGHMSTAAYRRQLRADGVPIEGRDVDHVFPRALGGADNVANYQLLPSSVNRSLGAGVADKLLTMPVALLRGILASGLDAMLCGR